MWAPLMPFGDGGLVGCSVKKGSEGQSRARARLLGLKNVTSLEAKAAS